MPSATRPNRRLRPQALAARIIELAQTRRRFGYRRLHDLLRPEYPVMNHKKVYRRYREANLAVRRKKVRRPPSERQPLSSASAPNAGMEHGFRQRRAGQRAPPEVPDGR